MRRDRPELVLEASGYGRAKNQPVVREAAPDKYTGALDDVWEKTYFFHVVEAIVSGGPTGVAWRRRFPATFLSGDGFRKAGSRRTALSQRNTPDFRKPGRRAIWSGPS